MTKTVKIFMPITKIDAVTRTITALITDETVDLAGEICDYETSAPLFKKWSAHAEKVTGGKSKGNLRAMHQPIAAGKLTGLDCDDAVKAITCSAKIVDDAEWLKCEEGVYTGLSLGGSVVGKMWKDAATGAMRFTVDPIEVSLVDLPCNPSATFIHVKAAGVEEATAFKGWAPSNEELAVEATALAAAKADGTGWIDHIDDARKSLIAKRAPELSKAAADAMSDKTDGATDDTQDKAAGDEEDKTKVDADADKEAAAATDDKTDADATEKAAEVVWELEQAWITPDGKRFEKKADAKAHMAALKTLEENGSPLAAALAKAAGEAAEAEGEPEVTKFASAEDIVEIKALGAELEKHAKALDQIDKFAAGGKIEKGMCGVSELSSALSRLMMICYDATWEAKSEGDGSQVPQMIADGIKTLGSALVAMAQEEVSELLALLSASGEDIIVIEAIPYFELAAVAAVIKADEAMMTKGADRVAKRAPPAETIEKLTAERDTLQKQIADAIPGIEKLGASMVEMKKELATAQEQITKLSKEPAPMPVIDKTLKVVGKGVDGGAADGNGDPAEVLAALIEKVGPDGMQKLMIKAAQANPIIIGAGRAGA